MEQLFDLFPEKDKEMCMQMILQLSCSVRSCANLSAAAFFLQVPKAEMGTRIVIRSNCQWKLLMA
jgi:hypothetical protein